MKSSLTSAKYSWPINEQKEDIQLSGDCEEVTDISAEEACDVEKRFSEEDEEESSFSLARPAASGETVFDRVTSRGAFSYSGAQWVFGRQSREKLAQLSRSCGVTTFLLQFKVFWRLRGFYA